ncbi:DUF3322 domain-containing protein [Brachybacterium sp. EE-P12]|uniref:DUF3322 domain-containing protein n=1 Tax=Brachybacterium sp. EE-P12 TaxID=2306299 RepID=UPI000F07755D
MPRPHRGRPDEGLLRPAAGPLRPRPDAAWIESWRSTGSAPREHVLWEERRWAQLGTQLLPVRWEATGAGALTLAAGPATRLRRAAGAGADRAPARRGGSARGDGRSLTCFAKRQDDRSTPWPIASHPRRLAGRTCLPAHRPRVHGPRSGRDRRDGAIPDGPVAPFPSGRAASEKEQP